MKGVIKKFFVASMLMWMTPVAILYGFNHNLLPGASDLSPHTLTLLSGFLAVISVNIVIAFYICMAMKEPSHKHEPDPAFLAEAKASVNQSATASNSDESSQALKKEELDALHCHVNVLKELNRTFRQKSLLNFRYTDNQNVY